MDNGAITVGQKTLQEYILRFNQRDRVAAALPGLPVRLGGVIQPHHRRAPAPAHHTTDRVEALIEALEVERLSPARFGQRPQRELDARDDAERTLAPHEELPQVRSGCCARRSGPG